MDSPNLRLAALVSTVKNPRLKSEHAAALDSLLKQIEENKLAPLYRYVTRDQRLAPFDEATYERLAAANFEETEKLKKAIEVAEESEDDAAVVESTVALGNWYAKLGDKGEAETVLRRALDLTASLGSKIDITLTIIRLGFFFGDAGVLQRELETARQLIDRGGDWERRNKYKTYRGLYAMSIRQFPEAANLLIESFATFTSTELLTYEQVLGYGVACGALALSRVDLKRRIVDSPEVLSLVPSTPELEPLSIMTNALYTGEYATFMQALAQVELTVLRKSPYLAPHSAFYVREMRCKAYAQLLESYMSLNLKSMARIFGVSVEYIEADLSRLVPQKKLNCVVDKVNGIVVTNRPNTKNAQYQRFIRQGDALLSKLQKYGAAVRLYGADDV